MRLHPFLITNTNGSRIEVKLWAEGKAMNLRLEAVMRVFRIRLKLERDPQYFIDAQRTHHEGFHSCDSVDEMTF